jgi:hypothetical protein
MKASHYLAYAAQAAAREDFRQRWTPPVTVPANIAEYRNASASHPNKWSRSRCFRGVRKRLPPAWHHAPAFFQGRRR